MVQLSIITPCYNEESNLKLCANSVSEMMKEFLPNVDYEHIFSDNLSTDGSLAILKDLAKNDKRIKVVVNSRNIGPFKNIYRAMARTKGLAIIPMLPADLQDPVDVIPKFFTEWKEGALVVFGERVNRQESFVLKSIRHIYYLVIRNFAYVKTPMNAGEFMLIDRTVCESLLSLNDHYPYIRGLVAQTYGRPKSIKYTWKKRLNGKSKNSLLNLIDQGLNGLISTSRAPARMAIIIGFAIAGLGILGGIFSLLLNVLHPSSTITGMPTVIVLLFLFGGIQLFFLGLIGEYVLSIHAQVRPEAPVFDLETINFT